MRTFIQPSVAVRRCLSACLLLFAFTAAYAHPAGWAYYQSVTITNPNGSGLTDFQVKVTVNTQTLIGAGKLQSDGDDLRFTDDTGTMLLSYWIESGLNTASTVLWVKIPSLPTGNTTVRLYYGNPSASAASNGEATFLLFDDFDGSSLNTSKWTESGSSGSITVSGGAAAFSANSSRVIIANSNFPAPYVAEMNVASSSGNWPNLAQLDAASYSGAALFQGGSFNAMFMGKTEAFGSNYMAFFDAQQSYSSLVGTWSLVRKTTSAVGTFPGGSLNSTIPALAGNQRMALGLLESGTGTVTVYWARARKYAEAEPTADAGNEQTTCPVVTFGFTGAGVTGSQSATNASEGAQVALKVCDGGSITLSGWSASPAGEVALREQISISGAVTYSGSGVSPVDRVIKKGNVAGYFNATYGAYGLSSGSQGTLTQVYTPFVDADDDGVLDEGECTGTPITLVIAIFAKPTVTITTPSQYVCAATDFTIQTSTTGQNPDGSPLTYQWYRYVNGKGDILLTGATGPSLTVNLTTSASYYVVVGGGCAPSVTSDLIKLTLKAPTVLNTTGNPNAVCRGASVTLSASASGPGPLSFAWRRGAANGPLVSTASSLSIQNAQPSDAGPYFVSVTSECTTQTTQLPLTVRSVSITQQPPASVNLCSGTTTLTVGVQAVGVTPTYQWRRNGQNLFGATSASLVVSASRPGSYTVVVSSVCGNPVTSEPSVVGCGNGRLSAEVPTLVVAPNPASGQEIRLRVTGMDNPSFGLTSGAGTPVGILMKTDGMGEFTLTPRQALTPGVYVVQAMEGTFRLSQRVLVVE